MREGEHRLRAILLSVQTQPRCYNSFYESTVRASGRNVIIFVPKRIRWNEMECGAGDETEPLYSLYRFVHVVSINWRRALAQQKPVRISQYVI